MNLQGRDAEPIQASVPCCAIGEDAIAMFAEAGQKGAAERAGAHVGESLFVDDVIAISGAQKFEEVEAALGSRGCEPNEPGVADLSAEAVLALVARPVPSAVIQPDRIRPARNTPASFVDETLRAGDQKADRLPLLR
jgi:hypothetical protein